MLPKALEEHRLLHRDLLRLHRNLLLDHYLGFFRLFRV